MSYTQMWRCDWRRIVTMTYHDCHMLHQIAIEPAISWGLEDEFPRVSTKKKCYIYMIIYVYPLVI